MDRQEFARRFSERQLSYLSTIEALSKNKDITWHSYFSYAHVEDVGSVSMVLKKDKTGPESKNLEELNSYIKFLTGDGFSLEVLVEWSLDSCIYHVASWEDDEEPDWPQDINGGFVLRWLPVKDSDSLGM
ncbi:hypothetical protein FLL45_02555 [Aliikangiella marina]|uniref:Uncharacterized protein n=1 Tax=Aliikangiella marina TaxID=1712262 RepID=A0A545TI41_9GAMM|nr:hypothetical protein [Aliikangiella marina]TQV76856.1 hypothetical protein FLL45_02555 [Aliikangiella marina]